MTIVLQNSAKSKPRQHILAVPLVISPGIIRSDDVCLSKFAPFRSLPFDSVLVRPIPLVTFFSIRHFGFVFDINILIGQILTTRPISRGFTS